MPTQCYFPAVMNGLMIVRAAFTCKCGRVSCDGCINRENHRRSRNKEQRIIDAANAGSEQLREPANGPFEEPITLSHPDDAVEQEPTPIPEQKASAKPKQGEGEPVKAQRTRRVKKGTA